MENVRVKIEFIDELQNSRKFMYNGNILIGNTLKRYCEESNVEFDSVYFLHEGKIIQKEDFTKPISNFLNSYNQDTTSSKDISLISSIKPSKENLYHLRFLVYQNLFYEPKCFKKYYKIIIAIVIIIIIIIIIFLIVYFKAIIKEKEVKKFISGSDSLQIIDEETILNESTIYL